MKKKILLRALLGAPIGILISYIITIAISLATGNGEYYPAAHELIADCGSEIAAVAVQLLCSLVFGAIWGGASVIWNIENWSWLKMTFVHLAVCCFSTFPIAFLLHWIPTYSALGTALYFIGFFAVYFMIWASAYFPLKFKVKKMNDKIKELNEKNDLL